MLPLLLPLIPVAVQLAEQFFGPKNGSSKLSLVQSILQQVMNVFATAGQGGIQAVDVKSLVPNIESVVAKLFPKGTTIGTAPSAPADIIPATGPAITRASVRNLIVWALGAD